MMGRWREYGSVSLNRSITAVEFPNPDCATSNLNFDTCLSMLLSFVNLSCFISSRALPGPSYGEKDFSRLSINAHTIYSAITHTQLILLTDTLISDSLVYPTLLQAMHPQVYKSVVYLVDSLART